jgi:hypothetical protein
VNHQTEKVNRSVKLIKGFMLLVIIMQVVQFFQTRVIDFGAIAGGIGVLSLLRGILLSPALLTTPVKHWFGSAATFAKESSPYFILAFVLIVVSAF